MSMHMIGYLEAYKYAEEEESSGFNSSLSVSNDYVYHYTSKNKARKIIDSCALLPSRNEYNDCLFGIGIYFTSLNPSNSKRDILFNNYGSETSYNEFNANAWIRIKKNNLNVSEINCNRNVWIYPTTQPLDLSSVDAEVACLKCNFGNITFNCNQCNGNGNTMFDCGQCNGSGVYQNYKQCWTCNGNGNRVSTCTVCDHGTVVVECDECDDGYGYYGDLCDECDGGDVEVEKTCGNCEGNFISDICCDSCNGTGNFFWDRQEECNNCNGMGEIMERCNGCNGTGNTNCSECHGNDVICL